MLKHFKLREAQMYGDIWYINRQALFLITIKYQTVLFLITIKYQTVLFLITIKYQTVLFLITIKYQTVLFLITIKYQTVLFLITIKYQTVLSAFKNLCQNDLQSGVDDSKFLGCVLYMLINRPVFKISAYFLLKFCFNSMVVFHASLTL